MGSRGQGINKGNRQVKIEEMLMQNRIDEILKESEILRLKKKGLDGLEIDNAVQNGLSISLKQCACCEEYTLPYNTNKYICYICGWIDDKNQNSQPNNPIGLNPIALNKAKENYKATRRAY